MVKTFPRSFVVAVGLLAGLVLTGFAQEAKPAATAKDDPRLHILENFFAAHRCPVRKYAADFLTAADRNQIDWRLLPSITFVETGGGRQETGNNLFGWNSGKHRFSSMQAAIYTTAERLGHSKLYRNKGTSQILRTYNKHPQWVAHVEAVMRTIGSEQLPETVAALH